MSEQQDEMFPEIGEGGTWKTLAYPYPPGSGPDGETCGSCAHSRRYRYHARFYWKCGLMRPTHSDATDIKKGSAACRMWQEDV